MPYPESCYTELLGLKGTCEPKTAMYWLNDVPGIDLGAIAKLAGADNPSGESAFNALIESAARFVVADVLAIYDGRYKVESSLVNGCSSCKFTLNYAAGIGRGTLVKDLTSSNLSRMLIDSFVVKINNSGVYHMVLDDGQNLKVIEHTFVAGVEFQFNGVNYRTRAKQVRMYFQEPDAMLAQLSCPRGSGCSCSGGAVVVSDLTYTGTLNGAETSQAYGFLPCATIVCEPDDLLCLLAHSAPRMVGMALMYKAAALFFESQGRSTRINRVANAPKEKVSDDGAKYEKLYLSKLNGDKTRGLKDIVFTTLQQTSDVCVVCNSLVATAWATG